MVLVKARFRLMGVKESYSSIVLADTGARMNFKGFTFFTCKIDKKRVQVEVKYSSEK